MPIKVLKASAGSGKTYRLTNDYVGLLNKSEHNQILAVTFTNKATEEMKSRIVKELNVRAKEKDDKKALEYLKTILHDYSHFNISTIDKFFQKIVRSMFRELGFSGLYNLVLDKTQLIEDSVDEMRMNLHLYKNAYNLLLEHALEKLKEGKDWSFSKELKSLTYLLWKEEFMNLTKDELSLYTYENVKNLFSECVTERENIHKEWADLANKAKESFTSVGLNLKKGSSAGILTRLDSFITGNIKFFTEKQKEKLSLEGVLTKDNFKKYALDLVKAGFDNDIAAFADSYEKNLSRYFTINAVVSYAIYLPVIVEINSLIRERLQDKNEFLLSEMNHLLAKMIGNEDAPFIYEKVGTQIRNYLLDEFQDTSSMQWKNFIPLVVNSVSNGNENLVVGDVKQSIYRWRNSDWNILAHRIKEEFKANCKEESLDNNWRSLKNIVDFNNSFFEKLINFLANEEIKTVYSDVKQEIDSKREDSDGGFVSWKVWKTLEKGEKIDYQAAELEAIHKDIEKVLLQGYRKKDIGILVRSKKHGVLISKYLLDNGINVISSESLLVSSSDEVKLLVYLLKVLSNKNDDVNKFILENLRTFSKNKHNKNSNVSLDAEEVLKASNLPLFERVERYIQIFGLSENKESIVYVQAFQDLVFDYNQKRSSDINGFLSWWELEGKNVSIEGSEGIDAVNILTIHKSKGLDYPVVMVPFCEWSLTVNNEIKWFRNDTNTFKNYLPLLSLKINKDLEETIFQNEYNEEMLYKKIDSLNLIYVALTRAQSVMYIYSAPGTGHDVYKWVNEVLKEYTQDVTANIEEDDNLIEYTFGELDGAKVEDKKVEAVACECGYPSYDYNNSKVKLNLQTENSLSQHKGNVLHGILQFVKTRDDAANAVKKAVRMGLIASTEVDYVKSELEEIFNNPQTKSWFDGTYKEVWNERTIISKEIYRPDRIMEKDGELLVVDYKFGEPNNKYNFQIKNYIKLLTQIGRWSNVRGCLYYHKNKTLHWA